jgi:hypothetical protein
MITMLRQLTMLTLGVLLALTPLAIANPSAYTGVISVDSVQVHPGDHFGLKVRINNNNSALSALSIPIRYNNPYLTLDSVSLVGSLKPATFDVWVNDNTTDKTVQITYLPNVFTAPVPSFSNSFGVLAEMFFHIAPNAPAQVIKIDSVLHQEIISGITIWTRVEASDPQGATTLLPGFQAGNIVVAVPTDVNETKGDGLPTEFALTQNYPNPFNPSTVIDYALPTAGDVKLEVFNLLGQRVVTLVDQYQSAGNYSATFEANDQPSGVYFYRLEYSGGSLTRKMILIK